MRIDTFEFHDHATGWHLAETKFDAMNLLVGVSGVGKTRIIESLRTVCKAATTGDGLPTNCSWELRFDHEGQQYRWAVTTATDMDQSRQSPAGPMVATDVARMKMPGVVRNEQLWVGKEKLISRDDDSFVYAGNAQARLKLTDSAVVLFAAEPVIAPIITAFKRLMYSDTIAKESQRLKGTLIALVPKDAPDMATMRSQIADDKAFEAMVRAIERNWTWTDASKVIVMVAFMLQEGAPSAFKEIESDFSEMFPSVKRIAVEPTTIEFQGGIVHRLRVYEEGIDHGIDAMDLSSGMFRALVHLIELRVAPPGSVLIVDEFENSLGANCLPAMTRALLRRAGDVQFILTSHHPYVINNIPVDDWKLVKRHGGDVSVVHAREVPALKGASHSVAFTRLINSEDYRNAIS